MVGTVSKASAVQVVVLMLAGPNASERFTFRGLVGTLVCKKRSERKFDCTLYAIAIYPTEVSTESNARRVGVYERWHVHIEVSKDSSACKRFP